MESTHVQPDFICLIAWILVGDEVITTPLTFCSTINSIIHAGATPILADVDAKTMNINGSIEEKITDKQNAFSLFILQVVHVKWI